MKKAIILLVIACFTLGSLGCKTYVFNQPATISTKSMVYKHVKPIKDVKAEYTDRMILFFPLIQDPRKIYDDLLAEAKKAGGNAVIDVQVRNGEDSLGGCVGLYVSWKVEAVGTAVVLE